MRHDPRRRREAVKTALIVLLTLSALVLTYFSPLVQSSGLPNLFSQGLTDNASASYRPQALPAAAVPARMAVGTSVNLYGIQYDQTEVDALFDQSATLLGEALRGADEPAALSESQWQALLSGQCVYFGYLSPMPLSALCLWLTGGVGGLTDSARHIILAPGPNGTLTLNYQGEEGGFFQCSTGLDADLHLEPILASVSPNSAFFAFESGELPDVVEPYTLFTDQELSPAVYDSASPLSLSDAQQVSALLTALSFSDQNQAPISGGMAFVDGEDTLRLLHSGSVTYHTSGRGKYTAQPGLAGAVQAAWTLADAACGPLSGSGRLYLRSAQASGGEECYTVTFGYCLNGSAVYLYDSGWAASFQVEQGVVTDFTIHLRAYSPSGEPALLLPAEKAAAALTALTQSPRELAVQYRDTGDSQARPYWSAL